MLGKRIILIRHGEAEHNVFFKKGDRASGARLLDPQLTPLGIEQAKAISELRTPYGVKDEETSHFTKDLFKDIELIVSSPLKRTVQTAYIIFRDYLNEKNKLLLHPDIQETGDVLCDTGQPHESLFTQLDSSTWVHTFLPSNMDTCLLEAKPDWHVKRNDYAHEGLSIKVRLARFTKWIANRSERTIAVVGHHNVFAALTKISFLNCEVREFDLSEFVNVDHDDPEDIIKGWVATKPRKCNSYSELTELEKVHIEIHADYCETSNGDLNYQNAFANHSIEEILNKGQHALVHFVIELKMNSRVSCEVALRIPCSPLLRYRSSLLNSVSSKIGLCGLCTNINKCGIW